jgi:ribosome-associated heat shock protein Hsp15
MDDAPEKVRLDKWLWAARFYKTRALASEAINGGHVHLNGNRAKPARAVSIGDTLSIRKGEVEFIVEVRKLSERRGPAKEALLLYHESEQSRLKREAYAEQRRLLAASDPRPAKRPDKRERRRIVHFTNRNR